MNAAAPTEEQPPGVIRRFGDMLRPGESALHFLGIAALVVGVIAIVLVLVSSAYANRASYYHKRNLRELDRVAATTVSATETLGAIPSLHFVPSQLHFALSPRTGCLVAKTSIGGASAKPIDITYHLVPDGASPVPRREPIEGRGFPAPQDPCPYRRLTVPDTSEMSVTLSESDVNVREVLRLTDLIWPITRAPKEASQATCADLVPTRPSRSPGPTVNLAEVVTDCFKAAALEDLERNGPVTRRNQHEDIVNRSIRTALINNAVSVHVRTSGEIFDLGSALDTFDAVLVVGGNALRPSAPPAIILKAGQIPPLIENEGKNSTGTLLNALLNEGQENGGTRADRPVTQDAAPRDREAKDALLIESSVHTAAGLVVFQKKYASLGGLGCSPERPCRLIGVVDSGRFNRSVRKIEGFHATAFLIGLLGVIGLLPLIHLTLRKRLDPMGPASQYVIWFSLTLVSASAILASLTFWGDNASRIAAQRYSDRWIGDLQAELAGEVDDWIEQIHSVRRGLAITQQSFPVPETHPVPGSHSFGPAQKLIQPPSGTRGLIETVEVFRADGFNSTEWQRVALNLYSAFGTNVQDRGYFVRASKNIWNVTGSDWATRCFVLDRVVARPDGMLKTVMMVPNGGAARHKLLQSVPPARNDEPCADLPTVPVPAASLVSSGRPRIYDPADPRFVLATGHLEALMERPVAPGFEYAVIDPDRPPGRANVLFHSRPSAELVERFERELDGARRFSALIDQALAEPHQGSACGSAGVPDKASAGWRVLRLSTRYRAEPVRLSISRLHCSLNWIVVVIERRDDAGMAAWRAASFGYVTWLGALAMLFAIHVLVRARNPKALDRRPGLWLWPRSVLSDFTPFRSEEEREACVALRQASHRRDRHIGIVLVAGLFGVLAAEGLSRTFFAFGTVLAAFAARSYFRGTTAHSAISCRKLDRYCIVAAAAMLVSSLIIGLLELAAHPIGLDGESLVVLGRLLLVATAAGLLGFVLREALSFTKEYRVSRRRTSAGFSEAPRAMVGWMLVLFVTGAMPAAAGYFDSIDHDFALIRERSAQLTERAKGERDLMLTRINQTRSVPVHGDVAERIRGRKDEAAQALDAMCEAPAVSTCKGGEHGQFHMTAAGLAMEYPGLHERALEFSDQTPFHMRGGWTTAGMIMPFVVLVAVVLLPLALVAGSFHFFRKQYFPPSPQAPPNKGGYLRPPLTCTRDSFVDAIVAAASQSPPDQTETLESLLPFRKAPGRRHLMLGMDFDVRRDERVREVGQQIEWVDLLEIAAAKKKPYIPQRARLIVIGNLDIALQLPGPDQTRLTLQVLEEIVRSVDTGPVDRHVFILADIEPLDRIALLRERTAEEKEPTLVDDWRWAALLQDFILCAVTRAPAPSLTTPADRELGVLDARCAAQVLDALPASLKKPDLRPQEEEMLVAYVAEQLADHYHKMWASSSDEERVLLYHLAWRFHLKMEDSRALRSLLVRGLIVRTPEYRLMNQSFARYVRRVERTALIRMRAVRSNGIDQVWPLLRYPLAALVGSLLILLQLVAPGQSTGAVGLLPALGAAIPTLIANWIRTKTAST